MSGLTDLEAQVLGGVSRDLLGRHAETVAQWERISGTPGERAAVDYLKGELEALGLEVTEHRFESLLGWPEQASLDVLTPETASFEAITNSFTPSTPPQGIEGDVIYAGQGSEPDLASARGRITLVEGMPSPLKVLHAGRAGAAGAIFIQEGHLHDMCVSPVWGTPTTRTAGLLPTIPTVSVLRPDGERLKALAAAGGLRVRMTTRTFWGWRLTPLLTAQIDAPRDAERFVLLSGHHCSWHLGAMDNGTADATILETARVLSQHRDRLRRSVRIAFWPGHTQGRYSGSAWYCDQFWEDLRDNCVLHVNCDSTGARGAVHYHATCMPETRDLAVGAVHDAIGIEAEPERQSRAGDQSFWGVGVPSIFMTLSLVPGEMAASQPAGMLSTAAAGPGLPWWWHTPEDTIDKVDLDVLVRDTRVYALATLRAAASPLLPFRYGASAREIRAVIEGYARAAGDRIDLSPVLDRARQVEDRAEALDRALDAMRADPEIEDLSLLNATLQELERELVLVDFTAEGPFDQDLALPIPPVPLLAPAGRLVTVDAASDDAHFLATELIRNRNRVVHHLRQAADAATRAVTLAGGAERRT
ncbi:MAG TPA: M28 family peptidase [Candidatus Dormibacteraeota bacterium]|jgi:hypothetical protein|nr:M28 family peptidase [Candidatus Dormibacteraeota bacterium]